MLKLFIVVNVDWFFLSHRLPIALEALKRGYDVTIFSINTGRKKEIESHGLKFVSLPTSRASMSVLKELRVMHILWKHYKSEKPDIIHHVALKPVVYGSIICRFLKNTNVINAIAGMGFLFANPEKFNLRRTILSTLFKFAFNNTKLKFLLQNEDDLNLVVNSKVVNRKQCFIIKGSGVDLNKFSFRVKEDCAKVSFVLPARLLFDKGVEEFVNAAKIISLKYPQKAEFILVGGLDMENNAGIPEERILQWQNEGYIKWTGFQDDMVKVIEDSDVIVLPSYREGLPKSLIEACAIGRPIITTNVPGCRDVVTHGINGLLVPPKNHISLAEAMEKLLLDKELRILMGKNGRKIAEKEFSIEGVVSKTFAIYEMQ